MKAYLIAILTLISACSGIPNLPKDRAAKSPVKVPYSIREVKIVDVREDVTTANWRLPLFTDGNEGQSISPAIEGELERIILRMINDSGIEGAPAANVTLYIDEAYYHVAGDRKSVSETIFFRCRLDFAREGVGDVNTAQIELSYEYNSVKVTNNRVKMLFEMTVRNGMYDALTVIAAREE